MQPVSGSGEGGNRYLATGAPSIDTPIEKANSVPNTPASHDAADSGLFKTKYSHANQNSLVDNVRFPGNQAQTPNTNNQVPQRIPFLVEPVDDRKILPGGSMQEAFENQANNNARAQANQPSHADIALNPNHDKAQTQVWNQQTSPNNQRIDVDYLTATPVQLEMPIQKLKNEWEQGGFDSLSTTNADAYDGQSVYLPWQQGVRTPPGDWKVFANHLMSKYNPSGSTAKVSADLDNPFSYNFDTQRAGVGAIEEKIHGKQFSIDEAKQAWQQGDWQNKLLNKPDNYHSEEVVSLPWNEKGAQDSVHILTWWRFLNELGGNNNPV